MTKTLWTKDFIRITLATSLGAAGGIISGFALSFLVFDETGSTLAQWPDWWAEGETEPFIHAYEAENDFAEPALTEEYRWGLITLRNRRMAEGLRVLLEQDEGEKIFATVGLLHLVLPEESVLRDLEAMGYQVEQVKE